MNNNNNITYSGQMNDYNSLPDFELKYSEEELNNFSKELSEEDEQIFKEILELEKQNEGKSDFLKELLEAAKKGTMQYLDSMTDTTDTLDHIKDTNSRLDDVEVMKSNHPKDPEAAANMKSRKLSEARLSPFDHNSKKTMTGMSENGIKTIQREIEAYKQRTKTITKLTSKEDPIHTSDDKENFESLSGLRGYRIGSPVQPYSLEEIKQMYDAHVASNGDFVNKTKMSDWVRDNVNFPKVYDSMMETYGFESRSAAKKWLSDNNLVIHETSDGLIIIPQDVHSRSPHKGYCSNLVSYLSGKMTKEDFYAQEIKEKISFAKHEAKVRGTRAIRGIGMSMIKDVLKCSIVVICEKTYDEFKLESKDKFIDRMLRIFKKSWEHVKTKCKHILSKILTTIENSILAEFLTALNDFFFGTFKNIFKVVRQMWSSIKSAFKIIFSHDQNISFGERMFEASKVLSAGVVSLIGFSLNELIEKGLTSIGIPFASFVSECLSGLFASIMSAIVIMLFDKFKKDFMAKSLAVQKLQLESKSLCVNSAQMQISSLQLNMKTADTYNFVGQVFETIGHTRFHLKEQTVIGEDYNAKLDAKSAEQDKRHSLLEDLKQKYINDDNF